MAITNGSGVGRPKPAVHTTNNRNDASLDDDLRQNAAQVVGFTTQSMITNNGSGLNPYQMIV